MPLRHALGAEYVGRRSVAIGGRGSGSGVPGAPAAGAECGGSIGLGLS